MKVIISLSLILCLVLSIVFCSSEDSTSAKRVPAKTETLLGFDLSHVNMYQQLDSLISYNPSYQITVDTNLVTLLIEDVDQENNRYDIGFPSQKLARFIITNNSVAMIGFYQKIEGVDSLFYFMDIPEILPSQISLNQNWSFYTPPIFRDGEESITSYLNYGFGYDITRTFIGTEDIVVPAGAYSAHIIQSEYRLHGSTEIIKTDTEYLAAGVGLIRMYSAGKFGTSHIQLISTENLTEE